MRRRGQEEIVGFVLIVLLVAIIFLVFLGISLRQPPDLQKESRDVFQFLESMIEYTSACAISFEPAFSSVGELIRECYESPETTCTSNENVCDVLESNLRDILGASWKIGPDRPIKAYIFDSVYVSDTDQERIVDIAEGNCSASFSGSEYLTPAFPGSIVSSLRLCF